MRASITTGTPVKIYGLIRIKRRNTSESFQRGEFISSALDPGVIASRVWEYRRSIKGIRPQLSGIAVTVTENTTATEDIRNGKIIFSWPEEHMGPFLAHKLRRRARRGIYG